MEWGTGQSALLSGSGGIERNGHGVTPLVEVVQRCGGSVATNTAYGDDALAANTTGANNVAVGIDALKGNTVCTASLIERRRTVMTDEATLTDQAVSQFLENLRYAAYKFQFEKDGRFGWFGTGLPFGRMVRS